MTKRGFIQVRVSEGEKAVWEGIAGEAGLSLSALVREAMGGLVVSRAAVAELPAGPASVPVEAQAKVAKIRGDIAAARSERERFVVPASCPAPSKKTFRPDFK